MSYLQRFVWRMIRPKDDEDEQPPDEERYCPECNYHYTDCRCDEQRGSTCSAACGWCGACS